MATQTYDLNSNTWTQIASDACIVDALNGTAYVAIGTSAPTENKGHIVTYQKQFCIQNCFW